MSSDRSADVPGSTDPQAACGRSEALERHERLSAMGEMMARLAHQLRAPLASALLYARQIETESKRSSKPASRICDRLEEIVRMIDDMLAYSGGSHAGTARVSVVSLFQDLLQTLPKPTEIERVNVAMARDDLTIEGNYDAIKGALLNLVQNALEACGASGRVELGADRTANSVRLTVSDNGPGIPAAYLDRVFDPFFTTRPNGTGLGLAVVRAVAEAHAGDVSVSSTPGRTTFAISLRADGEQA